MSTLADLWENLKDPKKSTSVNSGESSAQARCPRLTKAEIAALVETYRSSDSSLADIARQFKVHRHTAARHLNRAGLTERRKHITAEQLVQAIRLHKEGWSLANIGQHLGFSPTSINYRLRQAGVQTSGPARSRSAPRKNGV
jgi:AraC-like DNA-binding protein